MVLEISDVFNEDSVDLGKDLSGYGSKDWWHLLNNSLVVAFFVEVSLKHKD